VRAASAIACLAVATCASAAAHRPASPSADPAAPRQTLIAHLVAPVEARAEPGAGRTVGRIAALAHWNRGPVGLLVVAEHTEADGQRWLRVRLPDRPNGAAAWIPADRTQLISTPWRIVVAVHRRTVSLEHNGKIVRVYRAVVGKGATPTPTGLFAVSERIRQPDPHGFYGPWVLLLTAYSNTLFHFDGGPGQISIHGRDGTSLRDPLGTARSHGCIRISNAGITLLARVAVEGTPVIIRA
jgi:lipoprotein-anchoring transpeptidase ErfK/SrfK